MTDALPTDPAELQKLLVAERAAHGVTKLERDTERVLHQQTALERDAAKARLQALLKRYFGRSSEKLDPNQLALAWAAVEADQALATPPPPAPVDLNFSGKPSIPAIQSSTCVSSSVQAGLVAQSMPCTPSPALSSSPRMDGPELLDGKNAKKFGDCQWVMPGRMSFSAAAMTEAPLSAAATGSGWVAAGSPGTVVASLAGRGVQLPGAKLAGLPLYGAAWSGTGASQVTDLEYSDGLSVISLFLSS